MGRYYDGVVPAPAQHQEEADRVLIAAAQGLDARVDAALERFAPHEALAVIWDLVNAANKYVEDMKPWSLAKARKSTDSAEAAHAEARLATVLYNLTEALRLIAHYCVPFIPATAEALAAQLGIALDTSGTNWTGVTRWGGYVPGTHVAPGNVLFAKRELPTHPAEAVSVEG